MLIFLDKINRILRIDHICVVEIDLNDVVNKLGINVLQLNLIEKEFFLLIEIIFFNNKLDS